MAVKLFDGKGRYTRRSVHDLVAAAFVGPKPPGYEVNHKDTNKHNNDYLNLEYTTRLENAQHAQRNGRYHRGEQVVQSKLTELDVRALRALRTCGWSQRKLAGAFKLSQATVWSIVNRKQWKHV
jgi:hypothetical protein